MEQSRVFHVQAYQLAEALHDRYACAYSHKDTSKKYIPRADCPRFDNLREVAYELLEKADGIEFRPFSAK